jgi:hypothetical protein
MLCFIDDIVIKVLGHLTKCDASKPRPVLAMPSATRSMSSDSEPKDGEGVKFILQYSF